MCYRLLDISISMIGMKMIKLGNLRIVSRREMSDAWGQGYDVGCQVTRQHLESMIVAQIKFLQRNAMPSTVKDTNARILELKFILGKIPNARIKK